MLKCSHELHEVLDPVDARHVIEIMNRELRIPERTCSVWMLGYSTDLQLSLHDSFTVNEAANEEKHRSERLHPVNDHTNSSFQSEAYAL